MAKFLPAAKKNKTFFKKRTVAFYGLDKRPGAKEGSLIKAVNLSTENFPLLSPRKKRGVKKSFSGRSVYGFGFSEKLYYCAEKEDGAPYFYYDDVPYFPVSATEKTFAHVSGMIIVFPDKLYFSETAQKAKNPDAPYESLEALHEAKKGDGTLKAGDVYLAGTGIYSYNPEGEWNGNLTSESDANPTPFCHQAQTEWIYISDNFGSLETDAVFGQRKDGELIMSSSDSSGDINTVTDWDSAPELKGAKRGDAVTLTVRYRQADSPHESVYKKYQTVLESVKPGNKCYHYTFSGINVPEKVDADGTASSFGKYIRYSARITKSVPDFSVLFSHGNRLWGAKDSVIYASALGDPTVFSLYLSSAASSWSLALLSGGKFTGGCSYMGYPTFFKPDSIVRIAGDYPEEYMTMETHGVAGVAKGCDKSLAEAGGTLYYVSDSGPMAYSGDFPERIGDELGKIDVSDACAGADSSAVYFSIGGALYSYDVKTGLWTGISPSPADFFASFSGRCYALCADENTIFSLSEDEALPKESGEVFSEAVFSPIYLGTLDKKETGRLSLLVEAEEGAKAEFYISYDGGAEGKVFTAEGSGVYHVPVRLRRAESFSLKVKGKGMWRLKTAELSYSPGTRF